MKTCIPALLGVAFVALRLFAADADLESTSYAQGLASSDASVRAKAVHDLARVTYKKMIGKDYASEENFSKIASDLLPLLARGLNDENQEVRENSLQGLAIIDGARGPKKEVKSNECVYAPLEQGVLKAMTDTDPDMRSGAYQVYARCFTVSPEIQQVWIRTFATESNTEVKKGILKALLMNKSRTPETLSFVVGQLNNPTYTYDIGMAMLGEVKPPPPEALPILIQHYASSDEPAERGFVAQAIETYGPQARGYLPLLQSMLAKETDPVARENIQSAIRSIGKGPGATPSAQ